jgi:hypothetical protein
MAEAIVSDSNSNHMLARRLMDSKVDPSPKVPLKQAA